MEIRIGTGFGQSSRGNIEDRSAGPNAEATEGKDGSLGYERVVIEGSLESGVSAGSIGNRPYVSVSEKSEVEPEAPSKSRLAGFSSKSMSAPAPVPAEVKLSGPIIYRIVKEVDVLDNYGDIRNVLVDEAKKIYVTVGARRDSAKKEITAVHFNGGHLTDDGVKAWVAQHLKSFQSLLESGEKKEEGHVKAKEEKTRDSQRAFTINTEPLGDGHFHSAEVFAEDAGEESELIIGQTVTTQTLDGKEHPAHFHEIDTGVWGFMTSPGSDGSAAHKIMHPDAVRQSLPPNGKYDFKLYECSVGESRILKLRVKSFSNRYILNYDILEWSDSLKQIRVGDITVIPAKWLGFEGEIPAGNPGATESDAATYKLIDSGHVNFGARKDYMHEYFFYGKSLKGRMVFMREGYDAKSRWFLNCQDVKVPYVLQDKASKQGYVPPKGVSCLPDDVADMVPKSMRYWESTDAKKVRDDLLAKIKTCQVYDDSGVEMTKKSSNEFIVAAIKSMKE